MTAARPSSRLYLGRPPRWPIRRIITAALVAGLALGASATVSTISRLQLPEPTGPHSVGKHVSMVVDRARPEPGSQAADDDRQLRLVTWSTRSSGPDRRPTLAG